MYEVASGQVINFTELKITYSPSVDEWKRSEIQGILDLQASLPMINILVFLLSLRETRRRLLI